MTNLLCVSFDENNVAYTGAQNGNVIKWMNGSIKSQHAIHKGVVHCIKYIKDPDTGERFLLSGATDMTVVVSNPETMAQI